MKNTPLNYIANLSNIFTCPRKILVLKKYWRTKSKCASNIQTEIKNCFFKTNFWVWIVVWQCDLLVGLGNEKIVRDLSSLFQLVKNKTIIKDGANTGSNSVLVAPVIMKENSNLAAGSVLTKNLDKNALGLTRAALKILQNWVKK